MNDFTRQAQIMEILKNEKSVSVNKLVKTLFVSQATIRRDLETMAKQGLLKRTHGGAILFASSSEESSILIREETMKKEKREIAELCIPYLKNNISLFFDSSSTVSNLIPFLNNFQYLTIITNGLSTSLMITQKTNFKVFVPSGFVQSQSNSILGETSTKTISDLFCDIFIFSCAGLSLENGVTEASLEQADMKKLMLKNSRKKILLIDSSKFGQTYLAKSTDIADIDIIITDKKPEQKFVDYILQLGIELVYKK